MKVIISPGAADAADANLVQLRRKPAATPPISPLFETLIEKFFVLGALFGLIGGVVIGAHLWLMLNGRVAVAPSFTTLRALHALMQTYLFFGLFILGFLFQTAPKILKVHVRTSPMFLGTIPILILGIALELQAPGAGIGRWLIATPFAATFAYFASLTLRGTKAFRENYAWWVLLSLGGLTISPFFPVLSPEHAQIFVWFGVAPVTFAAGQQFIFAFLGGTRLAPGKNRFLFAFYLAALSLLFAANLNGGDTLWQGAGAMCGTCIVLFVIWTNSLRAMRRAYFDPLAFGFVSGYAWALTGCGALAFFGSALIDSSFHLLTLGWLTPLIIAISSQVLRAISGKFWLPPNAVMTLLVVWQLVPIGRGLRAVLPIPPWFSLVVITAAGLVLSLWLIAVARSAVRIMRKKAGAST